MAVDRKWLFDVPPAGTTLTNANIKSDDNASATGTGLVSGSNPWSIVSSTDAHTGLSAEFSVGAATAVQTRLALKSSTTSGTVSVYQKAASAPAITGSATAQIRLLGLRHASGTMLSINLRANGTISLMDGSTEVTTSAGVWTAGVRHRYNLAFNIGGTSTLKIYAGDSTTPIATLSTGGSSSAAAVSIDLGVLSNGLSATWVTTYDSIQMDSTTSGDLGPYVEPNDPPVVTAGPAQIVAGGASVALAFGVSDVDGTIASRTTTYDYPASGGPSITGGTGNTPSLTAGTAPARYAIRHTATDDDGATGYAVTEVFVPVAGAADMRPEPSNGTGVGTWTITGGSATHGAALADESTGTYVESPSVSGTEQRLRQRYHPSYDKASAQTVNTLCTDEGTATAYVRLYEGTTLRQSWTHALTTSDQTFTDAFSSGTIAAIADWKNLFIELAVVAS